MIDLIFCLSKIVSFEIWQKVTESLKKKIK